MVNVCLVLCEPIQKSDEIEDSKTYDELCKIVGKIIKIEVLCKDPNNSSLYASSKSPNALEDLVCFMIEGHMRIQDPRDIQLYPYPDSHLPLVKNAMTALAKQFQGFNFIYTTTGKLRRDIPVFIVCKLWHIKQLLRCTFKQGKKGTNLRNCWLFILHGKRELYGGKVISSLKEDPFHLDFNRVVTLNYEGNVVCNIDLDRINLITECIASISIQEEIAFVYSKQPVFETKEHLCRIELAVKHMLAFVKRLPEDNKFIVSCFADYRDFYNLSVALLGIPPRFYKQICIVYFHHTEPHVLKKKTFSSKEIIKSKYAVKEIVNCVYKGDFILYGCHINELATKEIYSFLTESKDWIHIEQKQSRPMENKAVESPVTDKVDSDEVRATHKPWRNVNANNLPREEFLQFLKDDIKQFNALKRINVLNIGYVGAGKSSFISTINSCLDIKKYVAHRAIPGEDLESTTRKLEHYVFDGFPHICLWDTRGMDDHFGLGTKDFECLLNGNIKQGYIFNKTKPISDRNPKYILHPSLADIPHVVCFVVDGNTIRGLLKEETHAITLKECLEHIAKSKELRYLILLTKMDQVCPIVNTDSSNVFTSETVKSLVKGLAACLNILPSNIVPIVNYNSNDTKTNISTNIVALIALRQLLRSANDFIANAKQGR